VLQPAPVGAVEVRAVPQGVHLVDADPVQPVGPGLQGVEQHDRLAVGDGHHDVAVGGEPVGEGVGQLVGTRRRRGEAQRHHGDASAT
jgi:hypothetical protein